MIQMSFNFFQMNHKTNSVNQHKIFFILKLSISKFNVCHLYTAYIFICNTNIHKKTTLLHSF